jgi:putative membrane protein
MRHFIIGTAGALVLSSSAFAQIGNPAGLSPSTPVSEPGKPAPNYPNTQDRLFVHLAGTGGMAEVEASKLASGKAQNPAVGRFAKMMVDEHSKTNERLKALAGKAEIPLPPGLDPDHKAMLASLEKLSGAEFDRAYMQGQLIDHQKTAQILQWEMSNGQDAQLQRLAADTLPSVLHHLQSAQAIMAELSGTAPQGLAAYAPGGEPSGERMKK